MTSWKGNIFRATDPLCGEFTDQRWIPFTKASDAELWYFLCPSEKGGLELIFSEISAKKGSILLHFSDSITYSVRAVLYKMALLIGSSDNGTVVLAIGHEARCILWAQVAIFKKGLVLMWIKILWIQYILWGILTTKSMFDVANMLKKITVKGVPINSYELLNIQTISYVLELHPISSDKL